jgi:DNA-directed RNA polymerase specialized sigma subunit
VHSVLNFDRAQPGWRSSPDLKEIAAVLKVTESRVCQLHSQSIARLRTRLREW